MGSPELARTGRVALSRSEQQRDLSRFEGRNFGDCFEVDRRDAWSRNKSFCALMLAPTIRHFLQVTDCPSPTVIQVHNTARPVIAGCLCYTRTLARLGFARINKVAFAKCTTHRSHGWFHAERTRKDFGESTEYQTDLVENEARKDIEVFNFKRN